MELEQVVADFAAGLKAADTRRPIATNPQRTRQYQPGIGPFGEDKAVALALAEMREINPGSYDEVKPVPYPADRRRCDLGIGEPLEWAIEVKMARAFGDNGKPDPSYLKDLLSPYPADRSALTDTAKLLAFPCRRAILVYGFDYADRALDPALDSLEMLMGRSVTTGPRYTSTYANLVHPVHKDGRVVAWEVLAQGGRGSVFVAKPGPEPAE